MVLFFFGFSTQAMAALDLAITANPDPVRPGETVLVEFMVTNNGASTEENVTLEALLPNDLNVFPPSLLTGGGTCPGNCYRNIVTWDLGTLAAGEGVTVTMPPVVASVTADETVVTFTGVVKQSGSEVVSASATSTVEADPALELSLTEDLDPVAPNSVLTYTLTYGNRSSGVLASNATLSMPLPTGTSFVSATGGGTVTGGTVEWSLGGVCAGEWGSRQLQVQVNAGASEGDVIKGEATIIDTSIPVNEARASSVTRVQTAAPLSLSITANPDPVRPMETLNVSFTVTNLSGTTRSSVVLKTMLPNDLNVFPPSLLTGGGTCPGNCYRNIVTWDLGTLAAGQDVTVTMPPVITSGTPEGTVIPFVAFVTDGAEGRAYAAKSVAVSDRPDITVDVLSHAFGDVTVGDSSDKIITIINNGNADLEINTLSGIAAPFSIQNDDCTGATLASGENCSFTTRFSPTPTGPFNDTLFIASNDPDEGSVGVSVDGTGVAPPVPDITVTNQVAFGDITVNTSSDKTVTISNAGTADLNIGAIAGLSAPFSIQNDNCSNTSLDAAESCTLTVRFEPTATGAFTDTMDIPSNDPDENPVSVDVEGTGVAAPVPDITVTDSVAPGDDLQVLFGSLVIGNTSVQTVTVKNDGSADLVLNTVAFADGLSAPFSIQTDNCSGKTLAPGGDCTLTVRFAPTATGPFNDTFDIPSNDPDEDPVTVSLNGTGSPLPVPEITVTDSAAPANDLKVPFGDVTEGNTSSKTVTVTNDGTADLKIGTIAGLAAPFSILSDNCSGMSVVPSGNCVLTVQFSPTATGTFNGAFDIPSNDADENPVTVTVNGTGVAVAVPDITVTDSVAPADDLQVPFGNVTEGATSDQTVTITNDGTANLAIGTIAAVDVLSAPFTIPSNTCSGSTLAPAGSCTLTVRFSPTATGTFSDSFDIPSDDPDENPVIVNVSGSGLSSTVNQPPSAPELVFPADGATGLGSDVTFGWNKSTDPDGDPINYTLRVCEDAALSSGCVSETVTALKDKGTAFAGLGLGFGMIFGVVLLGSRGGRKRVGLLLAVVLLSGTVLAACGSSGGGGGGKQSADIEQLVKGLNSGTTYHWKVTADDGKGGTADSVTWSFTTQ